VLAFAVTAQVAGIDVQVVGYILLAVGVLGLLLGLWMTAGRRQRRPTAGVLSPARRCASRSADRKARHVSAEDRERLALPRAFSSYSDPIASLNVALGRIAAVAFSRSTQ
jgi:hypothetical protein